VPLGMTQTELAQRMGVSYPRERAIHGKRVAPRHRSGLERRWYGVCPGSTSNSPGILSRQAVEAAREIARGKLPQLKA
jgi:hypothetical protein